MVATLQFIRPTLRQVLPRGLWAVETTCTLLPRTLTISIGSSARAKSDWASNQPLNFTPEDRKLAIQRLQSETYPRVEFGVSRSTCKEFVECYSTKILPGQTCDNEQIVVCGRTSGFRTAGSRLVFIDVVENRQRLQGICNWRKLEERNIDQHLFRDFFRVLQRGDILKLKGVPHRTSRGELSILLSELPTILSQCTNSLPTELQDKETRARNRHVDFLVNTGTADAIRIKSAVIQYIRQFLLDDGHIEVQTPILADSAGGAVARPFLTSASEFPDKRISLRIAPELWLKRMVVGGFDRVFEIGPSFRNEGIDKTHNPEFTSCEFYRAYTSVNGLMRLTEDLLSGLVKHVQQEVKSQMMAIETPSIEWSFPFRRLDFIPAIESAIGHPLPNLDDLDAIEKVRSILEERKVMIEEQASLPQIVDRLAATFLEPQCSSPTFIINHPQCLSPLAKCFTHPETGQRIAARAELFVQGMEIANMYEEENSPADQRAKFVDQLRYKADTWSQDIDENYLELLEWGLPPTGGWGLGVERLSMLLAGSRRIADVLSFGTLRNVMALRQKPRQM